MERLDLRSPPANPSIEASVHIARYANIIPLVKDKVVLDVACGEGYGSALLMKAGAKRVVGVDISTSAVENAISTFGGSGAEFKVADVSQIGEMFAEGTFDVIVSIETIEHVPDHGQFLHTLVKLGKRDAIFCITCPNDYWYYPKEEQHNPYHLRKYSFKEFAEVTTKIIGPNVKWGLGTATFGFGTAPLAQDGSYEQLYDSWIRFSSLGNSFVIPNKEFELPTIENCSYFVGIWNLDAELPLGQCSFPLSMNEYAKLYDLLAFDSVSELRTALAQAQEDLGSAQAKLMEYEQALTEKTRQARHVGLRLAAARSENKVIRENIGHLNFSCASLQQRIQEMEVGYWRYTRLAQMVPVPLRQIAMKIVRALKGR